MTSRNIENMSLSEFHANEFIGKVGTSTMHVTAVSKNIIAYNELKIGSRSVTPHNVRHEDCNIEWTATAVEVA